MRIEPLVEQDVAQQFPQHDEPSLPYRRRTVPLVGMITLALLLGLTIGPAPGGTASSAVRIFMLAAGGIVLLTVRWMGWVPLASRAFPRPLSVALFLFAAWAFASLAVTPFPAYGAVELLRLAGGLLLATAVARVGSGTERGALVFVPVLVSGLVALDALWTAGSSGGRMLGGRLQDEQMLGAILAALLPFSLAGALRSHRRWRRLEGLAATVFSLAMLVVTQNRSSWLAAAAGALVLLTLELPRLVSREHRRRQPQWGRALILVPLLVVIALGGLAVSSPAFSPLATLSSRRASTLSAVEADESFQWRRRAWDVAWRMLRAHPVLGWGIGAYPLRQSLYNESARTQAEILATGPGLSESAHNTYLQLGAELGVPGLVLYLGILGLTLGECIRARSRARTQGQVWISAAIAGLVAQCISGLASPAWEYPECSAVLWLLIGLAAMLARSGGALEEARYAA